MKKRALIYSSYFISFRRHFLSVLTFSIENLTGISIFTFEDFKYNTRSIDKKIFILFPFRVAENLFYLELFIIL